MTSRRAGLVGFVGFFSGILFWLVIFVLIYAAHSPPQPQPQQQPQQQAGAAPPAKPQTTLDKIVNCVSGPLKCLEDISDTLAPSMAYGAILGLIGLLIQLWWRGEWPAGQLNVDRPKVLDTTALVTVAVAAMIAGISAAPFLTGKMGTLGVVAFSYFVADAATLGVDKISALAQKAKAFIQGWVAAK